MRTIGVGEAVEELSALVAAAERGEPTVLMKAGRPAAVLVPPGIADHDIECTQPDFGKFLLSFPGGIEDPPTSAKLVAIDL